MNDKIILFEKHLKEEEKAENTINKYLYDIKEFYDWFRLVGAKLCEPACTGEFHEPYRDYKDLYKGDGR